MRAAAIPSLLSALCALAQTSFLSSASLSDGATAPTSSTGDDTSAAPMAVVSSSSVLPSIPSTFSTLALTSSSSTPASSSSMAEPLLETGVSHPPISSYTFSDIPSPSSDASIPGVYPFASPKCPPSIHDSPSVVPDFSSAWEDAYAKAKKLIANFTLPEKVTVGTGVGWGNGRCVGNIPPIGDWPGLCLQDSPLGVRYTDHITAFPAGINTAATWNRKLMRLRGLAMGHEFKGKGVNVALGPMMNLGRIAQGGRNWEGFGADPYLSGETAYETILGIQSAGVQACAKHYINNEQENMRMQESSNVDDRTTHELYAAPFLRSVMAGVASIMCSYNLINDTYTCENDHTLNHVLKEEIGFQGYVMSDWAATHTTISAIVGLDMTMPGDLNLEGGNLSYFGANLTDYVLNNTIPESRVNDMATRILAAWYLLEQDSPDYPTVNFNSFFPLDEATNEHIDVQNDHADLVRKIGAASTVLLKNIKKALPLKKPHSLVLVGSDAGPGVGLGPNTFQDQGGVNGILGMGWGSGSANYTYLVSPLEAIQHRSRKDRTSLSWFLGDWDLTGASQAVLQKDVAMVFVQSDSGENYITVDGNSGDRKNLTAWNNGDSLILAVAAQNNNTIVVTHSVGPLIIEPWIEHPNITAVVWAGVSGIETGNALADVLYGHWNPSGRLPYTIAKSPEDYPAQLVPGGSGDEVLNITYTEGYIDLFTLAESKLTWCECRTGFSSIIDISTRYTKFEYSNLNVTEIDTGDNANRELERKWERSKPSPHGIGSSTALWLHRPAYNVTFDIKNVGDVYGGDIPQLYIHHPPSAQEPPSLLRGFTHIELNPCEKKRVSLTLSRYDLSVWDVVSQSWRRPEGTIRLTVGASSRDSRLNETIEAC
ncbi:hypothetical protein EW146_g6883 [Bondarzewia mesenterica]|uniref:beta-glucosidase n=1 Tax=Bondarzewia mesenterica TaxID=1095465 RepID=A0A4S4LMA7_9AGAM|nr:hypothetical protein EW146_g6883 [Bondarzewia mesenterica]